MGKGTGQAQSIGELVDQQSARVVGNTLTIGADQRTAGELATLHLESAC